MGNINSKINLAGLIHQVKNVEGKGGKQVRCIIIPVEANHLYEGEKGIYLDTIGFEVDESKRKGKDTHLIKQSLPQKIREAMSKEEQNAMPILGNHIDWDKSEGSSSSSTSSASKSKAKASKADDDEPPF